jgi:hypothetical protein
LKTPIVSIQPSTPRSGSTPTLCRIAPGDKGSHLPCDFLGRMPTTTALLRQPPSSEDGLRRPRGSGGHPASRFSTGQSCEARQREAGWCPGAESNYSEKPRFYWISAIGAHNGTNRDTNRFDFLKRPRDQLTFA